MRDIGRWLEQRGLGKYADVFAENDVDLQVLLLLTEQHLQDLGVSLGHRLKILHAVSQEKAEVEAVEASRTQPSSSVRPERDAGGAERRQLTVMFCDLAGSTALSESMDPEEYREVLSAYQSAVRKPIESYEGYIARYMGDGLLAYFGYPQAHEEDAERAVRAALDIVEAVTKLEPREGLVLQVRIGIATGLVVVGDIVGEGGSEEWAVLGDTPNLAARLQGIAAPNSVLISESTQRLVEGRFALGPNGPHTLKGIREPVIAFEATGIKGASRFEAASAGSIGELVGRDEELAILLRRWQLASAGEGQVVLLGGEPGIGKSRLIDAIRQRVASEVNVLLEYQCSPYHAHSTFHPLIAQIEQAAEFELDDSEDAKLDKLEALFGKAQDRHWLVAELLSLSSARYPSIELSPEKRKRDTIDLLISHLESKSQVSPVLVILEDAHWVDPSTRELFDVLTDEVARMRVLLVVTHRPEFESSWSEAGHVTQFTLNRLGRQDVSAIVQSLAGEDTLPEQMVEGILDRTDGIPLFVEELTKDLLESRLTSEGADATPDLKIPSTIQDSLVARLDRLGPAKAVAQVAATIGREFPYALLRPVWDRGEQSLQEGLEQLQAAGLLYQRGELPDASYSFKHALVRDAAYTTMLRERRRSLHHRVAGAIAHYQPIVAETQPELLAQHLTEAEDVDAALGQWLLAGQLAFSRSAAFEAQAHLEKGRALIADTSFNGERDEAELGFCVALGPVYMTTKGAHSPETEQIYSRARELSESIGDPITRFKVAWGQWHVKQLSVGPDIAITFADECLEISKSLQDENCELQAHHAAWSNQFYRGEFVSCLEHTEHGWQLYDPERHADHRFHFGGHDPGACCRFFAGLSHWFLGRPETAARCSLEATTVADSLEHPFTLIATRLYTAYLAYFEQDYQQTRSLAREGQLLCQELGYPTWLPGLAQLHDWSLVSLEGDLDAFSRMTERITPGEVAGQVLPGNILFLVDACTRTRAVKKGVAAINSGLPLAHALGHRWVVPEFHRQHAALLKCQRTYEPLEVKEKLCLSAEFARQQHASSIELRAATMLAQVEIEQDNVHASAAVERLTALYASFDEGFDTHDLKAARSVMNGLTSR